MSYFGLIVGGMIAAIALVIWYQWHKSMTSGEESRLPAKKSRNPVENDSLEDFVAAYRRGDVSLSQDVSPVSAAAAPASNPSTPPPGERTESVSLKRDTFLSGATKLAYYVCRSGLRDHHVFAHVRMQSLCTGSLPPRLADASISLLVCNAEMSIVAAIDVIGPEAAPADGAKAQTLRSLGIRYLKLSPKSLPKPEDIRTLLYCM